MSNQWGTPGTEFGSPAWSSPPDPSGPSSPDQGNYTQPPDWPVGSNGRLESLQGEVASLKIRGGNAKIERQVRVGGTALMAIGVVLILIAWLRASQANTSVNNQIAYLISGGILGIAFVGIGGAVYLRSWLARQRYWLARQVVETREYTTQVLLLLARIEKVLGGTGELPGDQVDKIGSHWSRLATPPTEDSSRPSRLIGEPVLTGDDLNFSRDLGSSVQDDPLVALMHSERNLTEELMETAFAGSSSELGLQEESKVYTNEHGHVWDNQAQQWYDPKTHQWYDGVRGSWYKRDSAPPIATQ